MAKQGSELWKSVAKAGYIIERTKSSHIKVYPSVERRAFLAAQGVDVDNFPAFVIVSGTPSDRNGMRQAERDFRKVGYSA